MMKIANALIQCMMRSGNGCRRRAFGCFAKSAGRALVAIGKSFDTGESFDTNESFDTGDSFATELSQRADARAQYFACSRAPSGWHGRSASIDRQATAVHKPERDSGMAIRPVAGSDKNGSSLLAFG